MLSAASYGSIENMFVFRGKRLNARVLLNTKKNEVFIDENNSIIFQH